MVGAWHEALGAGLADGAADGRGAVGAGRARQRVLGGRARLAHIAGVLVAAARPPPRGFSENSFLFNLEIISDLNYLYLRQFCDKILKT